MLIRSEKVLKADEWIRVAGNINEAVRFEPADDKANPAKQSLLPVQIAQEPVVVVKQCPRDSKIPGVKADVRRGNLRSQPTAVFTFEDQRSGGFVLFAEKRPVSVDPKDAASRLLVAGQRFADVLVEYVVVAARRRSDAPRQAGS